MNQSMEKSIVKLFESLIVFSEQFGVEPPKNNDIGVWWKNALQEMNQEQIFLLADTFPVSENELVREMRETLTAKKLEFIKK